MFPKNADQRSDFCTYISWTLLFGLMYKKIYHVCSCYCGGKANTISPL